MKTTTKLAPLPCLTKAQNQGWNWNEFRDNDHQGYEACVCQALLEQMGECAYTGLWLGEGSKQKIHIDHFRKKGIYPTLTFEWNNLFAAAKELNCGADYKDGLIHGPLAHADGVYRTFWSPLQVGLDDAFWFQQDGKMVPSDNLSPDDKQKAQNTIDMFNLNDGDLVNRRGTIIKQIRALSDLDDDTIRLCMNGKGFSILIEKELRYRG